MSNKSDLFKLAIKVLKVGASDELAKLTAHILRVLAIYHGVCWRTELKGDVSRLLSFVGEPLSFTDEDIGKSIKALEDYGLVEAEYLKRGDWPDPDVYVDQLIHLKDMNNVRRTLKNDSIYVNYLSYRQKIIRESLRRQDQDKS